MVGILSLWGITRFTEFPKENAPGNRGVIDRTRSGSWDGGIGLRCF